MTYRLLYTRRAVRDIERLDPKTKDRIQHFHLLGRLFYYWIFHLTRCYQVNVATPLVLHLPIAC